MNGSELDLTLLGPAFAAGLLIIATHVPLGRAVLKRGIIFIDLAIAQVAGLGAIAAALFDWDMHGFQAEIGAFVAALLGALLLWWTEQAWPEIQEALIGVLFVLAATGGILLLAHDPHGGEHLRELLIGQILWVDYERLLPTALLYALVLAAWFGLRNVQRPWLFYPLFAVTVTVSVQLVGVYLVFASLIVPALAVRRLHDAAGLWLGYAVGLLGYALGLLLSLRFDLPAGAIIVWTLATAGLFCAVLLARQVKSAS